MIIPGFLISTLSSRLGHPGMELPSSLAEHFLVLSSNWNANLGNNFTVVSVFDEPLRNLV